MKPKNFSEVKNQRLKRTLDRLKKIELNKDNEERIKTEVANLEIKISKESLRERKPKKSRTKK